jgi:hypothetical protein
VCRYWGYIAIDTGLLWSFIYIGLENTSPGQFKMLSLFLERSGTQPLDISLIVGLSTPCPDDWHRFADQLALIFPAISRRRRVYVFGEMRHGIYKALYAFGVCMFCAWRCWMSWIARAVVTATTTTKTIMMVIICAFLKAVLHCSTSAFEAHSLTTCEPPLSALVSLHFAYGPEEGQLTFEQYRDALTVSTALTDLHLIGDVACTVVIGANGFPDHELSTITLLSLRKLNGLTSSTT